MLKEPAQDDNVASMTHSRSNRPVPARNGADEVNGARGGNVVKSPPLSASPARLGTRSRFLWTPTTILCREGA